MWERKRKDFESGGSFRPMNRSKTIDKRVVWQDFGQKCRGHFTNYFIVVCTVFSIKR